MKKVSNPRPSGLGVGNLQFIFRAETTLEPTCNKDIIQKGARNFAKYIRKGLSLYIPSIARTAAPILLVLPLFSRDRYWNKR